MKISKIALLNDTILTTTTTKNELFGHIHSMNDGQAITMTIIHSFIHFFLVTKMTHTYYIDCIVIIIILDIIHTQTHTQNNLPTINLIDQSVPKNFLYKLLPNDNILL